MYPLRIRELFSNKAMNCQTAIREDSFFSINLQLILLRMLGRVILLSSNKGMWGNKWEVDSISIPQLQRELMKFQKLLFNLC